jgi:hypothetical protein
VEEKSRAVLDERTLVCAEPMAGEEVCGSLCGGERHGGKEHCERHPIEGANRPGAAGGDDETEREREAER